MDFTNAVSWGSPRTVPAATDFLPEGKPRRHLPIDVRANVCQKVRHATKVKIENDPVQFVRAPQSFTLRDLNRRSTLR